MTDGEVKKNPNVKKENLDFGEVKVLTKYEEMEKQLAEYKDTALRRMAELENFRKSNREAARDARERAVGEVITAFLPALDAFERARTMIQDEKTMSGVSIIEDKLKLVLEKYGVTPMETSGDFDPGLQDCVLQVDSPGNAGKVVYEIEKGYYMKGKVLRYAKVAVGREEHPDKDKKPDGESPENKKK